MKRLNDCLHGNRKKDSNLSRFTVGKRCFYAFVRAQVHRRRARALYIKVNSALNPV